MSTFTHDGQLYEVQEFSPVAQDGFHNELWDLSAGGGIVGRIVVPDPGDPSDIHLELERTLSVELLLKWMYFVHELRGRSPVRSGDS